MKEKFKKIAFVIGFCVVLLAGSFVIACIMTLIDFPEESPIPFLCGFLWGLALTFSGSVLWLHIFE